MSNDGTSCSCICEDESWADHNILGSASCVPIKAYVIFGSVGIILSVAVLFQALYQLHLQLKFHAQQFSVSTAPAECCRKNMHVTAVANAVVSLFYFLLVLLVKSRWHDISVLVLILNQITVSVCGFLTVRMWIYTNDARLMQGSSTILRISSVLEEKNGQRLSNLVLSTGPVVATVLALLGRTEAAAKLVAVTFIMLIVFADTTFCIFGRALLRAIDASLQNSRKRAMESAFGEDRRESVLATVGGTEADEEGGRRGSGKSAGEGGENRRSSRKWSSGTLRRRGSWWGGEGRDESELGDGELQAAKRKVWWAMGFCAYMSLQGYAILLFSILSKYGTSVPLLLFGVQMAIVPLVWHAFNIQLHARRSRGSAIGRRSSRVDRGGRRHVVPAVGGGIGYNVGQVNTTSQQGQQQQKHQKHQKWIGGVGTTRWSKHRPALRGHAVAPTETDDAAAAMDAVTGETNSNARTGTTHPADESMSESVSAPPCRGV
ncbi:unnamed protein product, partial [Ectocarpus sp. 12 AP-2014]